jgi:hypothetical protein
VAAAFVYDIAAMTEKPDGSPAAGRITLMALIEGGRRDGED